ncbi:ribonuclease J [Mangrovicoccus algicola]|uniref:Ribonuclease J n=1 Tax=Mangrovicoccus algicola TaxID=2771008 RepID=A0A8J7CXA6_9RHOB|nr:ribonuclease J [Mangrovicoccus algicola]MBE3638712.1 ribonuclease J [Mangrovicoccus algicola]
MSKNEVIYLPLGGAGEIGMNCYVYGYGPKDRERLIVIDLGVAFPDMDTTPGVDLIFPDIAWLEERRDRIEAVFVTHAHEDHVGGVGRLWSRLKCPVYARPFTAAVARRKMIEADQPETEVTTVEPWPHQVQAGPFQVGYLPMSHSIPESSALVIDTPKGRILHTGDFKLDRDPGVGDPYDPALWAEVAADGVLALACDSTNVFNPHPGRSETLVGPEIRKMVAGCSGMVVATTFASNIARLKTLAEAGRDAGRSVVLLGRAMRRMVQEAIETGVLKDFPPTVSAEDAVQIPRENLMLLVTGSQGERRAASAQLARGKYLGLQMKPGDTFLFSSKIIPGNERGVFRIINQFSEMGIDVVDDSDGLYHVSGHANRPDLTEIHQIVRPQIVVPMHGEHRHLREHVKLAEQNGLPGILAPNGTLVQLSGGTPKVVGFVDTGRTYLDGSSMIGAMDGVVRDRIRMALNGHVLVTLIIDENDDPLGEPWCEAMGLPATGRSRAPLVEVMEDDLAQVLGRADDDVLIDDDKLTEMMRRTVRNSAQNEIGKKPEVTVVISRLSE